MENSWLYKWSAKLKTKAFFLSVKLDQDMNGSVRPVRIAAVSALQMSLWKCKWPDQNDMASHVLQERMMLIISGDLLIISHWFNQLQTWNTTRKNLFVFYLRF